MVIKSEDLLSMYRHMVLGRVLDQALSKAIPYWHGMEGEEAVIVGTFYNLNKDDFVSIHYRGAILAYYMRGGSLRKLIAGFMGKETGYTRGRISSKSGPFELNALGKYSSCLGTNLNMSAGAALAAKMRKTDQVVVVTFGDGTSNRGDFHEAINFASIKKLPVVFVCQNNQFGGSLRASEAMVCFSMADRALGYGIPGFEVDGNNVVTIHETVQETIKMAREGKGPSLIDAKTYRISGHNVLDREEYRTRDEVEKWKEKDPILRLKGELLKLRLLTESMVDDMRISVEKEVFQALKEAEEDPFPGPEVLELGGVFAPGEEGGEKK